MTKRKKATAVRHSRAGARDVTHARGSAASSSSGRSFVLSADCTVAASAALRCGLLAILQESAPVILEIAPVQRIDTAAMQLIAAFVRERESHGRQVAWRGDAPAFTCAARLLGLASVLGLPDQAP